MTNKHTPGPWKMSTVTTSFGICHKIGPFPGHHPEDPPRHACLYNDYPGPENPADIELLNNAILIAAAPETAAERDRLKEINAELLAALRDVLPHVPLRDRWVVRNVIAKATGHA